MSGRGGDDTYYVDSTGDTVIEYSNDGNDEVKAFVDYTLAANVENLSLFGIATRGFGNNLDNEIGIDWGDYQNPNARYRNLHLKGNGGNEFLGGGYGHDILDGGFGADTMSGHRGNDTYYVDNSGDKILEVSNQGTDRVYSSAYSYYLPDHVENLTLQNSANIGDGDSLGNHIIGSNRTYTGENLNGRDGNDILDGRDGHDRLREDNSADILNGGRGNDTLLGGDGNDVLDGDALNNRYEVDDLTGGRGAYIFVLQDDGDIYEGLAIIRDFNFFEGDKISLPGSGSSAMRNLDFQHGVRGGIAGAYMVRTGGDQVAFFHYNAAGGIGSEAALENLFRGPNSPIA